MVKVFGFSAGNARSHYLPTRNPSGLTNGTELIFIPPSMVKEYIIPKHESGTILTSPFNEYENLCVNLQWEGTIALPSDVDGTHTLVRSDGKIIRCRLLWDGFSSLSDETVNPNGTVNQVDIFPDPLTDGCMIVAFWASRRLGTAQNVYFDWERYKVVGDNIVELEGRWSQQQGGMSPVAMPAFVNSPKDAYEMRYWSKFSYSSTYLYAHFSRGSIPVREQGPGRFFSLPSLRNPDKNILQVASEYNFNVDIPTEFRGNMARSAYLQLQLFDGNGISFVRDMLALRNVLSGIKDIDFASFSKGAKSISDAYLSWHYGARLTISDTKSLISGMKNIAYIRRKMLTRKCSSFQGWYNDHMIFHNGRYSAFVPGPPEQLGNLRRILNDFDLLPTMGNMWDLIPYSFVVDWALNVGDVLDSIDLLNTYQKLGIQYSGFSVKATRFNVNIGGGYDLNLKFYHRSYSGRVWTPAVVDPSISNPFSHVIEGSALIIQRS